MDTQALRRKAERLLRLHTNGDLLLLVNAWDASSARIVEQAGLPAVASTSSGIANSVGYPDGELIPRDEMMYTVRNIARAVDIPVTADSEAGYGDVMGTTRAVLEAGAVGLNIEDTEGGAQVPIPEQCARIRAVRETAAASDIHMVINARCDNYLFALGDSESRFDRTVERMHAYAEAGADCLFVPDVLDEDTIGRLVQSIDRPLNILAMPGSPSIARLKQLGVRRVSLGGGPMRATMGLMRQMVDEIRTAGTYNLIAEHRMPSTEANRLMDRTAIRTTSI